MVYFLSATAALPALADRYDNAIVQEVSSSGQTVVINVGTTLGLQQKTPILIRRGDEKIVAARIVRAEEDRSVAYIVEKFSESGISAGDGYTLLWGDPNIDSSYRPADLSDVNLTPENPQNERFQETEVAENESPELDDEGDYNPEVILSPKLPSHKSFSAHNITVGVGVYRNADLNKTLATVPEKDATTTYSGYAFSYQYNFRTSY